MIYSGSHINYFYDYQEHFFFKRTTDYRCFIAFFLANKNYCQQLKRNCLIKSFGWKFKFKLGMIFFFLFPIPVKWVNRCNLFSILGPPPFTALHLQLQTWTSFTGNRRSCIYITHIYKVIYLYQSIGVELKYFEIQRLYLYMYWQFEKCK